MSERQGFGYIQTGTGTLFDSSNTMLTASLDASDYTNFCFQPEIIFSVLASPSSSFSSSIDIQSSLNGRQWFRDVFFLVNNLTTTTSASMNYLTGRRNTVRALFQITAGATGSVTGSLFYNAGP